MYIRPIDKYEKSSFFDVAFDYPFALPPTLRHRYVVFLLNAYCNVNAAHVHVPSTARISVRTYTLTNLQRIKQVNVSVQFVFLTFRSTTRKIYRTIIARVRV